MIAEILERDKAEHRSARSLAATAPSNLPADMLLDLKARPVADGARRVYNKAFKMPRKHNAA